jgi:hypothetical protein
MSEHCSEEFSESRNSKFTYTYNIKASAILWVGSRDLYRGLRPFQDRQSGRECQFGKADVSSTSIIEREARQRDIEVGHVHAQAQVNPHQGRAVAESEVERATIKRPWSSGGIGLIDNAGTCHVISIFDRRGPRRSYKDTLVRRRAGLEHRRAR